MRVPLSRCRPMSLVKKSPTPLPSISKVNEHNKELQNIGRGWGRQQDGINVLSPIKALTRFISNGWIWG